MSRIQFSFTASIITQSGGLPGDSYYSLTRADESQDVQTGVYAANQVEAESKARALLRPLGGPERQFWSLQLTSAQEV